MKKLLFVVLLLSMVSTLYGAQIIRKLGVEDMHIATGGTGSAETATDNGVTSTKIDATHIKLRSTGESVEDALDNVSTSGTDNASDLVSGTVAKARGGWGADVSAATGVPVFATGAISWKTLVQFLASVGVTFNASDNTWQFTASTTFDNNITVTGSVTATEHVSSVGDGYHEFNDMNTNGYLGTPTTGTTYYDNTLKTRRTYDGQYWRTQTSFISVPANENVACTQGQVTATDNWLYVCTGTSAPYWKTTHFDNVFRQTFHGDNVAGGGGGGTPPDNVTYADNFNRTNESPVAGNWTNVGDGGGQVNLTSNHLTSSQATHNQFAFRNSEAYNDNQWSRAKIAHDPASYTDTGGPGVRLRSNGGVPNGYIVSVDNATDIKVWAAYNSPIEWAQIGATYTGLSLTANDNITLSVTGNVLTLYINDVSVGDVTDTDDYWLSGGTPGINVRTTSSNWDDWSGGSN